MSRVGAIGIAALVVVASTLVQPIAEGERAPARSTSRAFTVTRAMTMNDPTHNRGTIARQLRTYINHTPSGATLSIMSFYLSSSITWPALRAAYRRGVDIRAVLYGGAAGKPQPGPSWEGVELTKLVAQGRANGRKGSWVVWTKAVARGRDTSTRVMHTKFWQFSKVGRTRKVTMIGSYNNGDPPDGRAYSAMVTVADPKLYDVTQSIFLESAKDRNDGKNPQRRFQGDGWDAYFFPSLPITRDNDPVLERLRAIPADAQTKMKIAMYSMQGYRGRWLAARLARMVRSGASLTFVVGPDVAPSVVRTLRKAGTDLQDGCWRTGRQEFPYAYTHDKEMTATWVEDGRRRFAAWIGSDDWGNGSGGSQADQATIGLYSEWAFKRLNKLLAPQIAHEPDIFTRCDPLGR